VYIVYKDTMIKTLDELPLYGVGDIITAEDGKVYAVTHVLEIFSIVDEDPTLSYKVLLERVVGSQDN
jgi:hypothetical protein